MLLVSRIRTQSVIVLAALLLTLSVAVPLTVQTTTADASTASVTKKKKKKKCSKGEKRNTVKGKKRCVRKKSTKSSKKVRSVEVEITEVKIAGVSFSVIVTTKTALTKLPVKVILTFGRHSVYTIVTATGDGTSTVMAFSDRMGNPMNIPGAPPKSKLKIEAIADGISSGVKTR